MRREVKRVLDAVNALEAIPDAGERAKALGELLESLPKVQTQAREMRQQAILALRQQDLTWREIGDLLNMHWTRAQQISKGESWRPKKSKSIPDAGGGAADGGADASAE